MRKVLMLSTMLSYAACASAPSIVTSPPASCAKLIPDSWATGVEAAPIPANEPQIAEWIGKTLTAPMVAAIIAPWASGYVAMSGQLTKANERTSAAIEIQTDCEAMVNAARPD